VSRAHIVLRFDRGRWVAIDNGSLNRMFVDRRRVSWVDISDGQSINISNPDGPRLTFEVRRHMGAVGRPPSGARLGRPPGGAPMSRPAQQRVSRRASEPNYHVPAQTRSSVQASGDGSNLATSWLRILRGGASGPAPGAITVGRATDNDIVISDVLASRHHATLIPNPEGVEIRDARSINGTFVNGTRVDEVMLREGDVVTISNVDLLYHNGTLVRRTETEPPTRTGGLEVGSISLTIEHGRTLLDNISFSARPGTLTAVIGPSGAGKSTLAKVIVGTLNPTRGTVSFEGHGIHGEYASLRSRIGMVPQDDVVHRQLTVDQALGYAAELRCISWARAVSASPPYHVLHAGCAPHHKANRRQACSVIHFAVKRSIDEISSTNWRPMMLSILPPIKGTLNSTVAVPFRREPFCVGASIAAPSPDPGAPRDAKLISPCTWPPSIGLHASFCTDCQLRG
jgi:ABC transport system ATP-binding/permease protein